MYISQKLVTTEDVYHIVNRFDEKTENEIIAQFGEDYQNEIIKQIMRAKEKYIVRLKTNNEPVAAFGIIHIDDKVGGIFLLMSDKIHQGNIITFLKGAKKQISIWEKKYDLILDKCYKEHYHIQKWLMLLGFKPTSLFETQNFKIFYKGAIKKYVE